MKAHMNLSRLHSNKGEPVSQDAPHKTSQIVSKNRSVHLCNAASVACEGQMLLPCTENSHDPFDRFLLTNKRRIDILTSKAPRAQDRATTHPSHDELILVERSPRTTQGTGKGVYALLCIVSSH